MKEEDLRALVAETLSPRQSLMHVSLASYFLALQHE